MAKKQTRKGGGGRLQRTQTVTVRMDPKQRYLAELAARKQRRTLSSFVEWVIAEAVPHVILYEDPRGEKETRTIGEEQDTLWDVEEGERLVRLGSIHPNLLTYDEQILWKLVRENGYFWKGKSKDGEWTWEFFYGQLHTTRLRKYWELIKAVARGEKDHSELPAWDEHGRLTDREEE